MSGVSIIIVSYQTGPALWLALDSALAQPECRELILVDNGNVPGVCKRLQDLAAKEPRLRIITGHGNIGFAKACNLGARQATADVLLLLNPDCMLEEGALGRALSSLSHYPENTLAGCYLINPDGSEQRACRRTLLTPRTAAAESFGLHRFFKRFQRLNILDEPMPEITHEIPAISGAFMLIARAFYNRLGGLNEGYFLHVEDMDFCYRVHETGGKVICMPDVKVIHFRSTSEICSTLVEKHKARGFIRYMYAHFSVQYSPVILALMSAGIWARYIIKAVVNMGDRLFQPPIAARQEVARIVLLHRLSRFSAKGSTLAGRTLLVTGATGQVGLSVVGKALAQGARVIALYHTKKIPFSHPNLTWVQGDLTAKTVDIDIHQADTLIHTAALWFLPWPLPAFIERSIKRVVAFSSTSVLGKSDSKNKYEQGVVAKLATAEETATKVCAEKNVPLTVLRPTMIYGAGLDGNITKLADVVRRFGFMAIYNPAKGWRHPVQAEDLAQAALQVIDNAVTYDKTYNLGGRETFTYRTMLERIFAYLGKPLRLYSIPYFPAILNALGMVYQLSHVNGEMALRMNRDLLFDIQPAIDEFGYHPEMFLGGEAVI